MTWFQFTQSPTKALAHLAKTAAPEFSVANGILSYSVQTPGEVAILFQDMLGKSTVALNRMQAGGHYSMALKTYNLATGCYIVRLRTGGIEKTLVALLTK